MRAGVYVVNETYLQEVDFLSNIAE